MKKCRCLLTLGLILLGAFFVYWFVQDAEAPSTDINGSRYIPARTIPVPTTVSPEMQEIIARPVNPYATYKPKTTFEWHKVYEMANEKIVNKIQQVLENEFPATLESVTIAGVKGYMITPPSIPPEHADKLIIFYHGGGYVLFGGEGTPAEAIVLAHYGKYKVLAIDYRMPPEYPFPAALDDVVAVYQEVIKTVRPEQIGICGTSAGGGLAAAALLKFQELRLPFPKVVFLGTPWSDLSDTGDSYATNEFLDNIIVTYNGMIKECAHLYAGSHDLKEPLLSPIYGTYTRDFPPTLFVTGTRDLFLSNTVRLFRKMREAGIEAELQVFEGMSHAFYIENVNTPESKEAYDEITLFLHKHL